MFTSGSPNSGQLQIGIALVLEDRFSNQARTASAEIRRLHQDAKNITNANLAAAQRIASAGVAAGTFALRGIYGAIDAGAEFIDTMTFVQAIARNTGVSYDRLGTKAKQLGRDTMFTANQIGSAIQFLALSGQTTTDIYQNIAAAANLANATMTEVGGKGGAADILTNIMRMYQIAASEENSTRIADVLTRAVTRSNTNLYDLGEAIKYAGTTASNLGATVEQTAAAVGVLGNAGIQGSMAGTALANAYRYLARSVGDPNFKGGKALRQLGLNKQDFLDANGQLIDLGIALQKIANAASGLGSLDQYNLLVSILGVRGERSGSTMIRAFQQYQDLLNEINNSQGAATAVQEQRLASLAGAINVVKSTYENLRISFTQALDSTITPVLRVLGSVFENLQKLFDSKIGPFLASFITLGTTFATIKLTSIALKATWRLMFNDSTVSIKNMMSVLNGGWNAAKINATQYAAIEAGIIAQRNAGIVGNGRAAFNQAAWASAAMANPGVYYGGYMARQNKNGQWVFFQKDQSGGVRRVSGQGVAQGISNSAGASVLSTKGALVNAPQAGTIAVNAAKSGGLRYAAGAAVGAAAGGTVARVGIGAALRGIVGFLGGPWGFALITVASLIPSLISVFKGNRDATESNTAALKRMTPEERRAAAINAADITPEERGALLSRTLSQLNDTLLRVADANNSVGRNGDIVINIAGEEVYRGPADGTEELINLGL